MAEGLLRRRHDLANRIEIGEIDLMETGLAARRPQARRHGLAARRIAPGQQQPARAAFREFAGDRLAQALAAASDDSDLAVEITAERTGLRQRPASRSETAGIF
jgi:hypothetical protein